MRLKAWNCRWLLWFFSGLKESRIVGASKSIHSFGEMTNKSTDVPLWVWTQGMIHSVFQFCCRSSSTRTQEPLDFPTVDSFSLLRSGGACPKVKGTKLIEHRLLLFRSKMLNSSALSLPKFPDVVFDNELGSVELEVCNYHLNPQTGECREGSFYGVTRVTTVVWFHISILSARLWTKMTNFKSHYWVYIRLWTYLVFISAFGNTMCMRDKYCDNIIPDWITRFQPWTSHFWKE